MVSAGRTAPAFRGLLLGLTLGLSALAPDPAQAQQLGANTGTGNNLDIEQFHPVPYGLHTVNDSRSHQFREFTVGLMGSYSQNPLVLFRGRLQVGEVIRHRFNLDLIGSVGILEWLELGIAVPLTLHQNGDQSLATGQLNDFGFRDLRILPKVTILDQRKGMPIGLAVIPEFTLPTGDSSAFLGDGSVGFSPHLLIDRRFDILWGVRAGAAIGAKLRDQARIGNIEISHELFYKLGGGLGLPKMGEVKSELIFEVAGASALEEPFQNAEQNPLLYRGGAQATFEPSSGHQLTASGGVSIGGTQGYGSPDYQVFLGLTYRRYLSDRDGDGIFDVDDKCPDDPEDKDGFEDEDGCPEPDNDKDGIPDVEDLCPLEPEDIDEFQDTDGCPDLDNDKDGIIDVKDNCPMSPEDKDGFDDEDGCPEDDADRDGIPDDEDKCPDAQEVINGFEDDDGCPDEGLPQVEVTSEKVTIDSKIMFDFDSARIKPESFNILNQVALTLKANMQLKRIRIEGHTDDQGSDVYNLTLSQKRAESVMAYLIERGVAEFRLEAVGYGESKPLVSGSGESARAKNRRVEFTILQEGDIEPESRRIRIEVDPSTLSEDPEPVKVD